MARTQIAALAIGIPAVVILLIIAVRDSTHAGLIGDSFLSARIGSSFSFDEFLRSPPFWLAAIVLVVVVGVFVSMQSKAAPIGNRIQELTGGLWQRWKA